MSRQLIAVDPGKTTGIFILSPNGGFVSSQKSFEDGMTWLESYVDCDTTVIIERYIIPPRAFNAPWSLEFIGAVRWLCHKTGATLVEQRSADAKKFATNDKLGSVGWHVKGDHARDAARHMLLYLASKEPNRVPPKV